MRTHLAAVGEVSREEGRRRAVEELSDPLYGEQEPSLIDRFLDWLGDLIAGFTEGAPEFVGGWAVLGPVLAVVAALVVWLVFWLRPSRGRAAGPPVHESAPMTATDHRAAADRHEAAGEFAAAVTERLRAISVDLEDRAVITPRAGRTATELASEASAVLPGEAGGLREGARIFNDVAYGDRPATADSARVLRELDARLRAARPAEEVRE
ncbi:hypothetical protein A6A08_11240 [Nocardiopsis sp. TSRI0078]|uniref:DUF4129 domain-containing protein n=1 Tax=unclassified Nocardiopsis TaxID=2649073 RepID=UPI00093B31AB|nr:DUF4129 domain-containing protein [Nocardiopsis sp. TSRI0078]OKI15097.1 hypothetical protein A6A08_11240 [Nocardiopsis sp. TSRI0078]